MALRKTKCSGPGAVRATLSSLVVVAWTWQAPARAVAQEGFTETALQAPSLSEPERGSIAGTLSRTSFAPTSLSRGTFALPAPLALPEQRIRPTAPI
jgi:hypothetical protein